MTELPIFPFQIAPDLEAKYAAAKAAHECAQKPYDRLTRLYELALIADCIPGQLQERVVTSIDISMRQQGLVNSFRLMSYFTMPGNLVRMKERSGFHEAARNFIRAHDKARNNRLSSYEIDEILDHHNTLLPFSKNREAVEELRKEFLALPVVNHHGEVVTVEQALADMRADLPFMQPRRLLIQAKTDYEKKRISLDDLESLEKAIHDLTPL